VIKKVVLNKEIVKIKGNYKVILIKKDEFKKFLKLVKLRILNKEYEALMPPLDNMQKNTIDVNGLSVLMSQFLSEVTTSSGNTNSTNPAQMVLTTQSGTVNLTYTGSVRVNAQGVSVYWQIFEDNDSFVIQYYYVGYDTTDSSYTTSQIELYASAFSFGRNSTGGGVAYYTNIVRIAYANASFTKTSDSYLFIVWLIQFQNVPPYTLLFIPTFQNNINIGVNDINQGSNYAVYINNNNCNFSCGGNCPKGGLTGLVTYVQGNSVIAEFPVEVVIGTGVSTTEILICSSVGFSTYSIGGWVQVFTISTRFNTTLSPPVSGGTFYLALATITLIFQTS